MSNQLLLLSYVAVTFQPKCLGVYVTLLPNQGLMYSVACYHQVAINGGQLTSWILDLLTAISFLLDNAARYFSCFPHLSTSPPFLHSFLFSPLLLKCCEEILLSSSPPTPQVPGALNEAAVMIQLSCYNILATVHMQRHVYPVEMSFSAFVNRFEQRTSAWGRGKGRGQWD